MLYTKWEFRDLLKVRGADIIQPDVCCCGGLTEMKKIAAMAEAEYVTVAPHNPMGPGGHGGQCPVSATRPTFLILEYHIDTESPRKDLVKEPYALVDGYLEVRDQPGLGIELNEDYFKAHPYKPWRARFSHQARWFDGPDLDRWPLPAQLGAIANAIAPFAWACSLPAKGPGLCLSWLDRVESAE